MIALAETDVLRLLSYARTALDEPMSLPWPDEHDAIARIEAQAIKSDPLADAHALYAVEKIDAAMHSLDVELYPALALRTMGRLIAEIADGMEGLSYSGKVDHLGAAADLHSALDLIDGAINAIEGDDLDA